MNQPRGSSSEGHGARRYELRVKGHLGARWADWFDGLSLTHASDGSTVIHGQVAGQRSTVCSSASVT
jgi:hypothetical protein